VWLGDEVVVGALRRVVGRRARVVVGLLVHQLVLLPATVRRGRIAPTCPTTGPG
jgi:hypothetical protein